MRNAGKEQMVKHIAQKIGSAKCICYCLTRSNCIVTMEGFKSMGINAASFYGGQSYEEQKRILSGFNGKELQVICATKALGRGVHIYCPVQFVIHTTMPTSLTGKAFD
jgi:superfamily II DNA helicase RecQ